MSLLSMVNSLSIVLTLTGCGQAQDDDGVLQASDITPSATAVSPLVQAPTPSPSSSPSPAAPIPLTYYKLTKVTNNAGNTGRSYTATGSCVQYNSKTYCWDDGIKSFVFAGTTFSYDYWNESRDAGNSNYWGTGNDWAYTSGEVIADFMTSPTLMSAHLTSSIASPGAGAPSATLVFQNGTPVSVSCTLTGNSLGCGDFMIDLGQPTL